MPTFRASALPPPPAACPAGAVPELTPADIDAAEAGALEDGRGLDMVARLSGGHLGTRVTRTCTVTPPVPAKAVWFVLTGRTTAGL